MAEDPCRVVEPLLRRAMPAAAAAEFSQRQSYRASGGLSAMRSSLRIQIRENSTDG